LFTKILYQENTVLCVGANGKLDIYNSYDYLEEIKELLSRIYTTELILDFSEISFVASIGLRTILELYKLMQAQHRQLKLKNVNEEVLHAFEMTGFDKFLVIENDPDNNSDNAPD
jgi:anti-anti-sigma factor